MRNKELGERLLAAIKRMPWNHVFFWDEETMFGFAEYVAEECAKVCEALPVVHPEHGVTYGHTPTPAECAAAIREKFKP